MRGRFIDIHCHILPEIDDGSRSWEESILMIEQAVVQGVTDVIATPHYIPGEIEYDSNVVLQRIRILQEKINSLGLSCIVHSGMELFLHPKLIRDIDEGKILSLADSKYLLVEFPGGSMPLNLINLLYEIRIRGFLPIIAHPERNGQVLENPLIINDLIEQKVLLQVNASSLIGRNGKTIQKMSHELVSQGLVSFVASDGHSPNKRAIHLKEASKSVSEITNNTIVSELFYNNAKTLINHGKLPEKRIRFKKRRSNMLNIIKKVVGAN